MVTGMPADITEFFDHDGVAIAYRRTSGADDRTGLVWLGGFHSDMLGEKATALHLAAERSGRSFVRFDYFGHGESGGRFEDGTVSRWRSDALGAIDHLTDGPLVLVGSSMGGWMALLCALARHERVLGLVLLAPAPDFTDKLMWAQFSDEQKREIMEKGFWTRPSPYAPAGYPIKRELVEDGRRWNVMDAEIAIDVPVRILQGGADEDVPWTHSFELTKRLRSNDVVWTFVKEGDHRLSRPQDIQRLIDVTLALAEQVEA
jgi:pimeloyl-ACP methyl ester carboxylesterase